MSGFVLRCLARSVVLQRLPFTSCCVAWSTSHVIVLCTYSLQPDYCSSGGTQTSLAVNNSAYQHVLFLKDMDWPSVMYAHQPHHEVACVNNIIVVTDAVMAAVGQHRWRAHGAALITLYATATE